MDSKFYISYKAARLLKEKGYNEKCTFAYTNISNGSDINGRIVFNSNDYPVGIYPCPTKSEAIDWLESKGIVISVEYINGLWDCQIYSFVDATILHGKALPMVYDVVNFPTRLEAEEAAIIKALELL